MRSQKLFALSVVLAMVAVSSVFGQSRTNSSGTGGLHVIQGRVYLPNGKGPDSPVKVELQSSNWPTLSVQSDQSGGFSFRGLAPGNYQVVVNAGEGFEIAREYITIDAEVQLNKTFARSTTKTFTVPLHLQPKRGQVYRSGVINAKWSNVPRAVIEHYENGLEHANAGKLTEAIGEFKQAIEQHRTFAPAHTELGKVYLRQGLLGEAIASFRTSLQQEPNDFDAHLHLGIALLNKMDLDAAEKELVESAYLNRHAMMPHYYLGVLFIEKKNYDIAQKALEKAKELKGDRDYPLLHRYLGGIYEVKKLNKQAIEELEIYLRLKPDAKDADRIRRTIADLKTKQS